MDQTKTHTNIKIHLPTEGNELLDKALEKVNRNEEVTTLWQVVNVNAIDRLGMTDHGPVHFQIVSNIAVRLVRLLVKSGIKMSITKDFGLSGKHAELVVLLASLFHDLGMSIQRDEHEEFSLFLANNLLHEIIDFLPVVQKTIVISESLHAIISHRSDGQPFTIEAGIVRVADALDMEQGRARIPFEIGSVTIHSVSALAIERVQILEGEKKPILVKILMSNSAGIFQIDELLKEKIKSTPIEKLIRVVAEIQSEKEKSIVHNFEF